MVAPKTRLVCVEWPGAVSPEGYGRVIGGQYAHRLVYEMVKGPIPEGYEIDHLCRNRACVRPEHLEAVTKAENIRRGESASAVNGRKTTCSDGHPFDSVNNRGDRVCTTCRRRRNRASYQRRKGQADLH